MFSRDELGRVPMRGEQVTEPIPVPEGCIPMSRLGTVTYVVTDLATGVVSITIEWNG